MIQKRIFKGTKINENFDIYTLHPDINYIFPNLTGINRFEFEIEVLKLISKRKILFNKIVDFGTSDLVHLLGM